MADNAKKVTTAAERKAQVEEAANAFVEHLVSNTGAELEASQRWLVCTLAVAALKCSGCGDLPGDACLKPGADVFGVIGALNHDLETSSDVTDKKQLKAITTIVHTLVNHQSRIDEGWHDAALAAIQESGLIPSDSTQSQYQSALVEIIILVSLAHAFNVAFLLMGKTKGLELPSLDYVREKAPKPHSPCFDPEDLLKPGQKLRQKDFLARSPFYVASQVDRTSKAFTSLSPIVQEDILKFEGIMTPYVSCTLAPQYFPLLDQASRALYYDTFQVAFVLAFLTIKGDKCPGVVRHDLETVAASLALTYACGY